MNYPLHSPEKFQYATSKWRESESCPGVRFAVRRLSLGDRLRLMEQLRDLLHKYEFWNAGTEKDEAEALIADLLVQRLYLHFGLVAIEGLEIDGIDADVEMAIERGPEALASEIVTAFRNELELSEQERKNF